MLLYFINTGYCLLVLTFSNVTSYIITTLLYLKRIVSSRISVSLIVTLVSAKTDNKNRPDSLSGNRTLTNQM